MPRIQVQYRPQKVATVARTRDGVLPLARARTFSASHFVDNCPARTPALFSSSISNRSSSSICRLYPFRKMPFNHHRVTRDGSQAKFSGETGPRLKRVSRWGSCPSEKGAFSALAFSLGMDSFAAMFEKLISLFFFPPLLAVCDNGLW